MHTTMCLVLLIACVDARPRRFATCTDDVARERASQVVFTGTVERVYRSHAQQYKGVVRVKRVLKGAKRLEDHDVVVHGFGTFCRSDLRAHDTRIFTVARDNDGHLELRATPARVTINNIASVESHIVHAPIQQLACESTFCAFGASCVVDEATHVPFCRCVDACSDIFAPVCGSDNITYSNECRLRVASCHAQQRVFVKRVGTCDVDPCRERDCRFGASCRASADGRGAECVCPSQCATFGDARGSRPVCGSDGRDYPNVCELRKSSCREMKEVTVKYNGACDPCSGVECPSTQLCQIDDHRNAICRCNGHCNEELKPVCASDGKTYTNECVLRVEACRSRRSLRIIHSGACGASNPCASLQCSIHQECEIDRYGIATCTCSLPCPQILSPVCGSDHNNYDNECELKRHNCLLQANVSVAHRGLCDDGACKSITCDFGAICVARGTVATCECPACTEQFTPVCGSDGISYPNACKMRREICEKRQRVELSFTEGLCNGCENKNCDFYAVCETDADGAHCVCPHTCVQVNDPVCGSDGITYTNECEMRVSACKRQEHVMVATRGACDVCRDVHCKYGARCENGACVCPTECPPETETVCGSDGKTHRNECEMRANACRRRTELHVAFFGACDDAEFGSGYTRVCDANTCRFGGVCDYDDAGIPHCACSYQCPAESDHVCGSDGRRYNNECELQQEMCRRQQEIRVQDVHACETACDGDAPLIDPATREEYTCGESRACPASSFCRHNKCCRALVSVRACSESTFGCCLDGETHAKGKNFAGCPDTCACNRLGSYSVSCDPKTQQCHCKPGVGGTRCDRCEAGFWGLHKIAEGNSGCIPCACNEHGSVRDDCEQTTGRCVCRARVQGMKCDVCPEKMILTPDGCQDASLSRTLTGTCNDVTCHFGAVCKERARGVQCTCEFRCTHASPVCGSDQNTYGSECQLKLFSCRYQRQIVVSHHGACAETSTHAPVRRSTGTETTRVSPTLPSIPVPVMVPAFDGDAFIELPRLEAHARLSLELELRAFSSDGLVLFNGQTNTGEGDFVAISLNDGYIHFRFNLGSGSVTLRSSRAITIGHVTRVVAKRYLWDAILSVEGQEDVSGRADGPMKSLDLAENLYLGHAPQKVFSIVGLTRGFVGCVHRLRVGRKDIDLRVHVSRDVIRAQHIRDCECDSNKTQCSACSSCPMHGETEHVHVPDFNGNAYLQLPPLSGVSHSFQIEVWFLSRAPDGLLFYCGGKGDFVALLLVDAHVQFRFDLGSGNANISGLVTITSPERVSLNEWNSVRVTRYKKLGSLQVNDGEHVEAESKGAHSELNVDQSLFIGGASGYAGLNGALQRLEVNGVVWRDLTARAIQKQHVTEFSGIPCHVNPCENHGQCSPKLNDFACQCHAQFTGKKCDKTKAAMEFDGTNFVKIHSSASENRWFVELRTRQAHGLVLWLGNRSRDHLALSIDDGRFHLRFDLGQKTQSIKSLRRVDDNTWHVARVHRKGRAGELHVDDDVPLRVLSELGASQLNTDHDVWIGGFDSFAPFIGCVSHVNIDGQTIDESDFSTCRDL